MNLTIEISWWIIPALVTLAAFIWAYSASNGDSGGGSYSNAGQGLMMVLCFMAAAVPSLTAWLVWALLS